MKTILTSIMAAIMFSVVVFSAGYAFFYFGPLYETRFMPVFTDTQAAVLEVDRERGTINIVATGQKARPCEWKSVVALVRRNGEWIEGAMSIKIPSGTVLPPNTISTSRPTGKQHLGEAFISPVGDRVQVFVQHRCHPLWQTQTLLYELDMTQRPAQVN